MDDLKKHGWLAALLVLAVVSVAGGAFAKTCNWTAAGGGSMNDPANWDENGVPASGDTVLISGITSDAVITNDLPSDVRISQLQCTSVSSNDVTIVGDAPLRLEFSYRCIFADTGNMTFDCPVVLEYASSEKGGVISGTKCFLTFNDLLSVTNAASSTTVMTLSVGGSAKTFYLNGGLYAPMTIVRNENSCSHYFGGPLVAKSYTDGIYWTSGSPTFSVGGCSCPLMIAGISSSTFSFNSADVLNDDTVLSFDLKYLTVSDRTWSSGVYKFNVDQTFDHVESQPVTNVVGVYQNVCRMEGTATATMKSTCDVESYVAWNGGVSVVYDPTDDYTFATHWRTNTTTGSITVKGGTFSICDGARFANVQRAYVDGGVLEVDSAADSPLASVAKLNIGDGAVFRTSSSVVGNPLNASVVAKLDPTAKMELSSGTAIVAARVEIGGLPCAQGVYTGVGHGSGSVMEASWIDGAGTVEVTHETTFWKAAASGSWSDADNWSGGVPSAGQWAYVVATGSTFTVTVPEGTVVPNLVVFGSGENVATVSGGMAFTNAWIDIGSGGRVEVPTGSSFEYSGVDASGNRMVAESESRIDDNSPIRIHDGGEFVVTGGTALITNLSGFVQISGTDAAHGVFKAESGTLSVYVNGSKDRVWIADGGRVEIAGDAELNASTANRTFYGEGDASITFSDSATANMSMRLGVGESAVVNVNSPICGQSTASTEILLGWFADFTCDVTCNISNGVFRGGRTSVGVAVPGHGYFHKATDIKAVVNVLDGGELSLTGSNVGTWMPIGLLVGYAAQAKYYSLGYYADGTLNVMGGAVTNRYGHFLVGAGLAKGAVNVSGGIVKSSFKDSTFDGAAKNFVVGAWHGVGTFTISGGTLDVGCNAWFGGVFTNDFSSSHRYRHNDNLGFECHDASGTFTQSGGDVMFGKRIVLGADGTGAIERIGSSGTFTAADIVFSNTVENADSGGVAKFTLDADGVAPICVTNKLVLGDNAKLVVDSSAYPARGNRVKLFSYSSLEGEFEDVEMTGAFAEKATLEYGSRGIYLYVNKGLTITVR